MFARMIQICSAFLLACALTASLSSVALADNDGVVRVRSAYPIGETVERLKKDIADKGIRFFSEIDQSKLAAEAGIKLQPSVLLIFGNPPLGTQFITANANAGLDWPVRLLVFENEKRAKSGRPTPTSTGSPGGTESRTARINSRWLRP